MSFAACLLIILVCLLIQAFFSASEMALISANRLRLRHLADSGSSRARSIQNLLDNPQKFLATTMVGANLVLVLSSTVASYLFSQKLGWGNRGPWLATVIMLPLILIFSEIVPKTLARPRATELSLILGIPLRLTYYLLFPLIQVVSFLSARLIKLIGGSSGSQKMFVSEEDLLFLIREGEKQGALTEEEREMVSRVLDFRENEASDIMVPLIDVALAAEDSRVSDLWDIIQKTGYSRIPIYRERVDKIIGTVQATDLVLAGGEEGIRQLIRPPYIVPESKPLNELLEELRHNDVNIAIVVDEYGGVAGIVTLENVIEEIVGEIRDEYDREETVQFRLRGEVAEVSGRLRIDELNEKLNLNLPEEEEEETIAGFIIGLLGSIPAPGAKVEYAGHQFRVTQATDRRIVRLEIRGPAVTAESRKTEVLSKVL